MFIQYLPNDELNDYNYIKIGVKNSRMQTIQQ